MKWCKKITFFVVVLPMFFWLQCFCSSKNNEKIKFKRMLSEKTTKPPRSKRERCQTEFYSQDRGNFPRLLIWEKYTKKTKENHIKTENDDNVVHFLNPKELSCLFETASENVSNNVNDLPLMQNDVCNEDDQKE